MQLHPEQLSVEQALAEFIAAAFAPEEREIARLKARLEQLRPNSHARIIVQQEMLAVRTKQIQKELARG